jgi:mitotic spindle assembly checkpoint protein MAD2
MPRAPPLTHAVTADDQVKSYIKKIMSQLKDWMYGGKISKLVIVITSKESGEHVERWQFDVRPSLITRCIELTRI